MSSTAPVILLSLKLSYFKIDMQLAIIITPLALNMLLLIGSQP